MASTLALSDTSITSLDSSGQSVLPTAVTAAEFKMVGAKILAKCNALDGVTDGQMQDVAACQAVFNLQTDVPSCSGAPRDGSCLTAGQKTVLTTVFAGPRNSQGEALYSNTQFDPGIAGANFADWHFSSPATLTQGRLPSSLFHRLRPWPPSPRQRACSTR